MVAPPLYVTTEQVRNDKTGDSVESTPAAANGGICVGSNDGRICALDADSGEQL
ncbi:MAG: PQQ-binding-like beta-propeller repeat protein [Caldilineaceae bacterium]|nr:PQQ-binding-like beta-propeller repeat protein [Caldilineaceae bacterium]